MYPTDANESATYKEQATMPGQSSWINDVTEETFEELVIRQSFERPVIVDFWAKWCGPCKTLTPILEKLVNEKNGAVALAKIDVDANQLLAQDFGIQSIPAVRIILQGQLIAQFNGLVPETQLRPLFDKLAPKAGKPSQTKPAAKKPLDPAEAEKLYRQQIDEDPNNETARIELARLLVEQDRTEELEDLLSPIGAAGENGAEAAKLRGIVALRALAKDLPDEATLAKQLQAQPNHPELLYAMGCRLASKGQHQQALDMLLHAAELDRKLGESKVRNAMVQIFYVIGTRSETADQYRKRLTQLLY
jgi:putative thioredoxin